MSYELVCMRVLYELMVRTTPSTYTWRVFAPSWAWVDAQVRTWLNARRLAYPRLIEHAQSPRHPTSVLAEESHK